MGMGVGIEIPSPRQPWPGVRNEGQKPETQGPTAEVVFLGSAVSSPSGVQGGVPVAKGFFVFERRQIASPGTWTRTSSGA